MGPPINIWPYSHTAVDQLTTVKSDMKRSVVNQLLDNFRVICLNFTFAVVCLQVMMSLSSVGAGPVVLNMDYMQGPVPLGRNIRHLPCISRRSGQEGLCMFAIDCLKANGSHLGTCIDRFYFGSCCQIPDKTILPQIITNHIDDNSIDNANFVHPQTEDKVHNKIPDVFTTAKKPTTQKVETTTREATERTDSLELETKSDQQTTLDNRIINDEVKLTTAAVVETTTKSLEKTEKPVTEAPIKLSTFQTVSGEVSTVSSTEKIQNNVGTPETTAAPTTTTTERTRKPTRRPVRPFTRPTYKPVNSTRPIYSLSTYKPKPPISLYNTTRKPPYRPPNKPATIKPFPIPPRLNITILPQSTSSKPLLTRPSSASITYINTTQVATTKEEPKTTTTTSTSTTTTTTTSTTTTEKVIETTEAIAETTILTTEATREKTEGTTEPSIENVTETEKYTTIEDVNKQSTEEVEKEATNDTVNETTEKEGEKETIQGSDKESENETNNNAEIESPQYEEKPTTERNINKESTSQEFVIEKATVKPITEADIPTTMIDPITTSTSTEYPPLVTWTNTVDAVTKTPETTSVVSDETWSPITPQEGWILLSTINPETSSSTTTSTTTTTTEAPTTEPASEASPETTIEMIETTEKVIETVTEITSQEPIITTSSTATETTTTTTTEAPTTHSSTASATTEAPTTKSSTDAVTTHAPIPEFTVNITLSPTVPTTTSSVGLTTFTSVTTFDNATKANDTESSTATNVTEAPSSTTTTEISLETLGNDKNDYKKVCGRRLWQAPTGRIVGGEQSGFGMWPWQISLRQYRTSTYLHKCGAALLNENWAITAAHCVEHVPPSELLVRLGEHDLANEDEPYGFAERRVQIVASHPHFDPATFEYDLALLRFYEPVKFQPNILPICVPDTDEDYVGKTAYVTGWGRLYDEGPLPSVLQEVKVPVINNTACESMYQAAGYNEHIPNIFICAGRSKGGTDSCEGDSGGPMVIPRERDGRFVLGGIISWGIGCAEPNQPGVYTRISEFRDWINQILQF